MSRRAKAQFDSGMLVLVMSFRLSNLFITGVALLIIICY